MNNQNIKLHDFQKQILSELVAKPAVRFNDLLIIGLESEHMNYHLQKLVSLSFVVKQEGKYALTDMGKDYSNLMDDEVKFVEKQPKTSVLLHAVREGKGGEVEHLLSRRLKHPYFGKVGRLTGKVRFGEQLADAARRELYEETGLEAEVVVLEEIYHKLRRKGADPVQDVIFYRFFMTGFAGEFIEQTPSQENIWVPTSGENDPKYDLFDDLGLSDRLEPTPLRFVEQEAEEQGY